MNQTMSSMSRFSTPAHPAARKLVRLMAVAMLSCCATLGAQPASKPENPSATAAAAGLPYRLSFKQLGVKQPFNLRGVDGRYAIPFNVRADEVITKATLKLSYAYSPELLSELSKINVLINGEVAASLPLPKDGAGAPVTQVVNLPPQLITEYNQLTLQLIGHYTTGCEDPQHSSLWANISNQSELELSTDANPLPNDLAALPEPFFDARDGRSLRLPVVFQGQPDNKMLEAAGTMVSWFGARANGRILHFPAAIDLIPAKGNAIVFLSGQAAISGMKMPSAAGPALAVFANPNDPAGKLLLVMGRDSQDLKLAARALANGSKALTGPLASITEAPELRPRRPYDAPNWLRADRPVKLSELSSAQALDVTGYDPGAIAIKLRLPPDLFVRQDKGVPLNLQYRYTPQPTSANSSLTVDVNGKFVKSVPLLPIEKLGTGPMLAKLQSDETLPMQVMARIPLAMLQPRSQIDLRYQYDYIKQGECRDVIIDNVRGAIDPDSTIDISGYGHFLAMPDLAAFGRIGFPYTRLADLSQTAVVLPDQPKVQELSAYLDLLGRLGESTGYPGTGIEVVRSAQVDSVAAKDLLLIASGDNQPLLKSWAGAMPAGLDDGQRSGLPGLFDQALAWLAGFLPESLKAEPASQFSSKGMNAFAAGFESPLRSGRSVVLLWGADPNGLQAGIGALLGEDLLVSKISGSLAVLRGQQVEMLNSKPTYHVGDLDWFTQARMNLSGNFALLLLIGAFGALLLALPARAVLRAQANRRSSK